MTLSTADAISIVEKEGRFFFFYEHAVIIILNSYKHLFMFKALKI